ncbi:MAG: hypothetical protein E2O59_12975, partial [Gammaproteobacteria bacterium]
MPNPKKLGVWVSLIGFVGAISVPLTVLAADEPSIVEEIVVTGSYIKRDSFDSASPLTVITGADIELNGVTNLGEIMYDLPFNYGSSVQTNTFAARPQASSFTSTNLRGLGPRATLQLIDGKRTSVTNLNSFVPQIAIARMDILKDGASALYGTDAVAGVVNVITRKDFSGIKTSFFHTEDKDGDLRESVYDIILGADTDNGHITMAMAYKTRNTLEYLDRKKFARGQWSRSGTGNPGTWAVPDRDPATGALVGTSTRTPDPGCGVSNGPGGDDLGSRWNYLSGQLIGTTCNFHFGETWNYMN